MTLKIKIPGAHFGADADKFRIDPILPDQGALLLIDPMHPAEPWGAGVVGSGTTVPNLAETQARALIGGSASLDPTVNYDYSAGSMSGLHGFVERSAKGGLHAAFTQRVETDIASSKGVGIGMSAAIRDWIATTGMTHKFFVSLWSKITRVSPNDGHPHWVSYHGRATSITGGNGYAMADHNGMTRSGAGTIPIENAFDNIGNVLGDRRRGGVWEPYEETPYTGGPQAYAFTVGSYGTENTYQTAKGNAASQILHRFYLEDLTVSGRTGPEVAAIDLAQWQADVQSADGRYYGDTFITDPATIP